MTEMKSSFFYLAISCTFVAIIYLLSNQDAHFSDKPDPTKAFVRVSVVHSKFLAVLGDVIGWAYFLAWSISFYPQIYENWKRKR